MFAEDEGMTVVVVGAVEVEVVVVVVGGRYVVVDVDVVVGRCVDVARVVVGEVVVVVVVL